MLTFNITQSFSPDFEAQVKRALALILAKVNTMNVTLAQLADDLAVIKTNTVAYIASRDAIDTKLKSDLDAAVAAAAAANVRAGVAEEATAILQSGIDAAFAQAEEDKGLLAPPAPAPAPAATPVDAAPADAAPADAAPADAAPVDAAPVDTAPVDAAPVDAAPAPSADAQPAA